MAMKKPSLESVFSVVRDHLGLRISRIHPRATRRIYVRGSSVRRCDGHCCLGGTTVSTLERDRILQHAGIVAAAMTRRARRDPSRWFGRRVTADPDFTVGRATFTRVQDGACVFFRDDRLCALQVAAQRHLSEPYALKPSVCILWPLAVSRGAMEPGYGFLTRRRECCAPLRSGGSRTILQVIRPAAALLLRMRRRSVSRGGGPAV